MYQTRLRKWYVVLQRLHSAHPWPRTRPDDGAHQRAHDVEHVADMDDAEPGGLVRVQRHLPGTVETTAPSAARCPSPVNDGSADRLYTYLTGRAVLRVVVLQAPIIHHVRARHEDGGQTGTGVLDGGPELLLEARGRHREVAGEVQLSRGAEEVGLQGLAHRHAQHSGCHHDAAERGQAVLSRSVEGLPGRGSGWHV